MYKSHISYQLMEERERNGKDCDCEEEQKMEKEMVEKERIEEVERDL